MVSEFVKLCKADDLAEGKTKLFLIDDQPVLLARHGGDIYALDGICTHDGGDLEAGEIIDGQIECPRHGARFAITTGEVTRMPAVIGLRHFEVLQKNGEVFVSIAE